MSQTYAELHCHSNFSFLDGTSDPDALVERAAELGLAALALTDSHGLYGIVRFMAAIERRRATGGPPGIVGAELTLEDGERIVLLVRDLTGYRNLCWLLTQAHLRSEKGRGQATVAALLEGTPALQSNVGGRRATSSVPSGERVNATDEARLPPSLLLGRTEGLIALVRPEHAVATAPSSTVSAPLDLAPLDGLHPVPGTPVMLSERRRSKARPSDELGSPQILRFAQHDIEGPDDRTGQDDEEGRNDPLVARLLGYRELFGADNVFVKTRRHLVPGEGPRNGALRRAAVAAGLRCVATNDVRYATKDGALLQDVVTAVRLRVPLPRACAPEGGRPPLLAPNHERYLKGPDEMARLFRDHPEELAASAEIAARCTFDLRDLRYEFPRPDVIPDGEDSYEFLIGEVWKGAQKYYGRITPELQDRIIHELGIVKLLELPGYLLVFKDVVDFCHRERILVSIRGSAPASVLLYCLGLCPIDPLEHGLLFERFASPERGEYPDIDLDIAHEDRERVIQYVYERYGRTRAAMVCEVNTYRARSAVRDVAFALGLPQHQIDSLAKTIDLHDDGALDQLVGEGVDGRLVGLCRQLVGVPRHLSIHVGGMIISARPLAEVTHMEPARMPGRTIIPWDKDDLATLGEDFGVNLIKMDLLGLGMLALVSRVFRAIEARGEERPSLHGFRYDERVYDMLCVADTVGLFQIESRAQISFLPRLQPRNLHDVAISVGAIRPGPGATGAGGHIALRRAGKEPITYLHPDLEPVLKQTAGVLLWQEQVMQVATIMAGFTLGEGEQLRRAMTHKRSYEHMHALCDDLVRRMLDRGHPPALAEEIRRMVIGFAGYGFPRAHAYPFAHLALVSATLKLREPAEYYAALLNCQPMGFYAPHTLIWDAHRHGVQVLPVDANASRWECAVEGGGLRLGFTMVRGLGGHAREVLERERANGPYRSLADFARRTGLDRDAVERLAEVGAFLRFDERRAAIWRAGELAGLSGPNRLPGLAEVVAEEAGLPAMDAWESTRADYGGLGLSPDRHLVAFYRPRLRVDNVLAAEEVEGVRAGMVRVGGLVICRQRPETAREFMFMTIEDETGLVNVVVRPDVYRAQRRILRGEPLLVVEGVLAREDGVINILARRAWPLPHDPAAQAVPSHNYR